MSILGQAMPTGASERILKRAAAIALVSMCVLGAAQSPAQFDVASIKMNRSPMAKSGIQAMPGGRLTAANVTLRQLIEVAFHVQDFQIVGGPGWLGSDRFDVVAKAEDRDLADLFENGASGGASRAQLMLQALLADRFKLAAHKETRDLPTFVLVPARNDGATGPQLRKSARACGASEVRKPSDGAASFAEAPACDLRVMPGTIQSGGVTLARLAASLSPLVGRVVRDRTNLDGRFEFTLRFTPDRIPQGFDRKASAMGLPPIDADGPSLVTALREQLGLRLDAQRGPVDVLVVDRADHPTEN